MPAIGVYLIFAAVVIRTAVVLSGRSEFPVVMALLAGYGMLLFRKSWLMHRGRFPHRIHSSVQFTYLFLQTCLVIASLILSSYEDFVAMLFIPLSLDAVSIFGRRVGFLMIAVLSLAMTVTLLFSDVGWIFGLVMGLLYSGICLLFGGYVHQVQKAKATRDQNEQMIQELQLAYDQLQKYADQKASLAIEQERNRLAHELHDSVTQTVFSMNLAVQSAHLLLDKEMTRAVGQLVRVEELAVSAQREIQTLVSQLKPDSIVGERLPNALRQLAAELQAQHRLQISMEIYGEAKLSQTVATGLYCIVHEALINASKHSGVCVVAVRLNLDPGNSCLEIEDHGRGFNPEGVLQRSGHLGLAGMREHAYEIGWKLFVLSRPGHGTRILATENPPVGLE